MKNKFIIKKIFIFLLVLTIGVESFAATVDSSDGAAFITKKEFEELKSNFNQQIELYDVSLSRKIDGAITDFLNGLRLEERKEQRFLAPGDWYCAETGYAAGSSDYTWRYKYGSPRIYYRNAEVNHQRRGTGGTTNPWKDTILTMYTFIDLPAYDANKHAQHKLLISDVQKTNRTAAWAGIAYSANDIIYCADARGTSDAEFRTYLEPTTLYWGPWRANQGHAQVARYDNFNNKQLFVGIIGRSDGGVDSEFAIRSQALVQDFGTIKNKNLTILNAKTYMNFSLYPTSHYWHFYNSGTTPSTNFEKLWTDLDAPSKDMPDEFKNCWRGTGTFGNRWFGKNTYNPALATRWDVNVGVPFILSSKIPYRSGDSAGINYGDQSADVSKRLLWPCVGFEDNYITNWNQLYLTQFDSVAKDNDIESQRSRFLKDDDGNYHVGIINGLPLFKCDKAETKVNLDIDLRHPVINISNGNETYQYKDSYVWISESPFVGWPNDNADLLAITSLDGNSTAGTGSSYNKAIKIPAASSGIAKIQVTTTKKNNYLWMKWTTNGTSGGGLLKLPETCIIEVPK